jgi:hypothetical protein
MKNLFQLSDVKDILARIDNLKQDSQRRWGKMDVAQMLAHCSASMEMATGQLVLKRLFIGRILGPAFKSKYLDETPLGKNSPTDKNFIITDKKVFEQEKTRLKKLVQQFADGGIEKCTTHPHSFFGNLTPRQWSIGMYKHLDHHLRQFGSD